MNEDAINENHISPKSSVVEEKNNRKKPNKPKKPKNTKPFKKHKILKKRGITNFERPNYVLDWRKEKFFLCNSMVLF